jgi:DNA-directed RNA polymerase specialized sigma24 family protein
MSEIVERTREDRFEELFREHYRAVRGYALRRAPGDLAQDVVSETFLAAWRRLDDVPDDALPWLYGVARRVPANQRRSADRGSAPWSGSSPAPRRTRSWAIPARARARAKSSARRSPGSRSVVARR